MADEKEKTVSTEPVSQVPKAFDAAMDAIESENEKAAAEIETEKETSAEEETVGTEVSEEILETPVSEEAERETGLSAEEAESLKGIDPDVLEVCRDYGWDDKKIAQVAAISPELFDDVREELDREQEPPKVSAPEKPAETKKAEFEELKFNLDPDVVGADVKTAIDSMAAVLNKQAQGLSEEKGRLQAERSAAFNNRINACFDRHAKELMAEAKKAGAKIPVLDLGYSPNFSSKSRKELTLQEKKQVDLRKEIFAHAQVTADMRNIPIEKAIKIEVNRYKNQDGEKAAEQRVLNKLQKQQPTYTNRPSRRLSTDNRKFATEAEEIEYRMAEAEQKAGLG